TRTARYNPWPRDPDTDRCPHEHRRWRKPPRHATRRRAWRCPSRQAAGRRAGDGSHRSRRPHRPALPAGVCGRGLRPVRLETARLILRPWEDRDREPLARIMSDPQVRRFYPRLLTPEETSAEMDAARTKAAAAGFHFQAAEAKADGSLVGLLGLG